MRAGRALVYWGNMKKYDLIIVLASQPDPATWKFPKQMYECLNKAAELMTKNAAPYVITSGKESTSITNRGLHQPFRECDVMADYLHEKGVPAEKLLKEGDSQDTISNLYYLKTEFLIPRGMKRLLFVVADFRIPRLRFLCERILGGEYTFVFEPIASEVGATYNEPFTFKIQSEFLAPMKPGDHEWLTGKFFTDPVYQFWAEHDREKYGLK